MTKLLDTSKVVLLMGFAVILFGCTRVEIDDPVDGSFTNDASITVSGDLHSVHPANPPIDYSDYALTVNGASVPLGVDGTFSTTVNLDPGPVFNIVEADLVELSTGFVDSDRVVVVVGDSIPDGDYSREALALQINESGLDSLEPVVTSLFDFDIGTLMPVGTVVINNACLITGLFNECLGRGTISITSPSPTISDFEIDFDPAQDQVNAEITLNDFEINLYLDGGPYILVPNCDINLTADSISLNGAYSLEPDQVTPSKVDVAQIGNMTTSFVDFEQNFTSGTCSTFLIGDIIQLIVGDIEPMVRSGFEDFLNDVDPGTGNTLIAASIESALAGVDVSGPVGDALNTQLDSPLFQIQETSGGITLGADARFVTNFGTGPGECIPPVGAPDLDASYHVDQPFPLFGATTPSGIPYGIGLGISSSGFNQLMRSMVECGLLIATIEEIDLLGTGNPIPLTLGLLDVAIPGIADAFGAAQPARIELKPTLAPIMTGAPGPEGELALLKIAQLHMIVSFTRPNGTQNYVLEVMLDADVGVNLGVDPATGALAFELTNPDPANVGVKVVENKVQLNASNIEALLPNLMGEFLPSLAGGLGSFPLPTFLGLSLDVVEVSRNGEMLTIFADLDTGGAAP